MSICYAPVCGEDISLKSRDAVDGLQLECPKCRSPLVVLSDVLDADGKMDSRGVGRFHVQRHRTLPAL